MAPAQRTGGTPASETKYRNLFEHMPHPLAQLDSRPLIPELARLRAEGVDDLGAHLEAHPDLVRRLLDFVVVDEANPPMVALLGGREARDLLGPISRFWRHRPDTTARTIGAYARGETSYSEETQVTTLDGRAIDVAYSTVFPTTLNVAGISIVSMIDITERQRATAELARSEAKYRILFDYMPLPLVQTNSGALLSLFRALRAEGVEDLGAYIDAHPGFLDHLLEIVTIDEVNQPMVQLVGAADKVEITGSIARFWKTNTGTVRRTLEARFRGDKGYVEETQIDTLDGRLVDIVYSVAYPPELNTLGIAIATLVDDTERKRATEEIRQSEIKYRTLFNQTPIALWQFDSRAARPELDAVTAAGVTDVDAWLADHPDFFPDILGKLKITEINDAALEMFGAPDRETLRPDMLSLWLHGRDLLRAAAARVGGARSYSVETQARTMDGKPLDILASIFFGDLNLVGAVDISDRKRAEEMLRKVQAEFAHAARVATLGELTASIAHEVNQPLAAIATNGEASLRWLARDEPDIEEVRALAGRMVADARRAADVIARIRTMATGRAPEQVPMSVNEAAEDAIAFLRHEFELHRIALRLELALGLPPVRADRTQLQQVLVNLAVNAMQVMTQHETPKPTVTLRTSRAPEGGVLVEIEDSGPGIPEDHLAQLFESFFTTKEGGLGIGLSICRSIVEAHGGRIGAANLPVGARFSFTLPAA